MDTNYFRNAQKVLKQIAHHWGVSVIIAQVIAVILFPIIEVVLALPEQKPVWYVWLIIGVLHFLVGIYSIVGSKTVDDFVDIIDIDQLEQKYINFETDIKQEQSKVELLYIELNEHFRRQVALQTSLLILNRIFQLKEPKPTCESVEKLLAPLISDRADALGYRDSEYYNFAIYIFDPKDRQLKIFDRQCDDRIQRSDRQWGEGVGHVGIAFARGETIIKSDAREDSEYKGRYSLESDDKYYASYISSPIFDGEDSKKNEIGVFVVTSSRPNHFEDDDKIIIESYSSMLSLYFSREKGVKGDDEPKTA